MTLHRSISTIDPIIHVVRKYRWRNGDIGLKFYSFRESYSGPMPWRYDEGTINQHADWLTDNSQDRLRLNLGDGNHWKLKRDVSQ